MASTYGVPEGSSLADWPLAYSDVEPFYERAEWELGVAGDGRALRDQVPRHSDYPLPAVPPNPHDRGAQSWRTTTGLDHQPCPFGLINTLPYGGARRLHCLQILRWLRLPQRRPRVARTTR